MIAYAGGLQARCEIRRAKQHIPKRKKRREIDALILPLVPCADGMMPAMKRRAHQQPVTQPAEIHPRIDVRQTLDHAGGNNDHHKLARRHAERQRRHRHCRRRQHVVQQMVAVIRPETHLPLAVMQTVQRPPPVEAMLQAVHGVFNQINQDDENHERRQTIARNAGNHVLDIGAHHIVHAQPRVKFRDRNHQQQKNQQRQHTQPMEPGVDHVRAHGFFIRPLFDRAPRFQRLEQRIQHDDFNDTDHHRADGFVRLFDVSHEFQVKHQRLHRGFKEPALDGGERLCECFYQAGDFIVAKQKPRAFKPVSSGSNTTGAHPSLRERMPRCMTRMSPSRMSRSAFFSSRSLG